MGVAGVGGTHDIDMACKLQSTTGTRTIINLVEEWERCLVPQQSDPLNLLAQAIQLPSY